jgi:LysM repeat protein
MKLTQLNESASFNFKEGIQIYFDKKNKTFRFATVKDKNNTSTYTVKNNKDFEKLSKKYKVNVSMKNWIEISNQAKKNNKDRKFKKALDDMNKYIKNTGEVNKHG